MLGVLGTFLVIEYVIPVLRAMSCTQSTFLTNVCLMINMNAPGWLIPVEEVLEQNFLVTKYQSHTPYQPKIENCGKASTKR